MRGEDIVLLWSPLRSHSCVDPRTAIADANPILKEPEVALANGDDRARRLRIAGWTFVGVGAAIPVVVWSTVTHKTRDDDSLVGIARGRGCSAAREDSKRRATKRTESISELDGALWLSREISESQWSKTVRLGLRDRNRNGPLLIQEH